MLSDEAESTSGDPTDVILIDTSAWIEFLRATQSPAHKAVRQVLETAEEFAVTDAVFMELLAGVRTPQQARSLESLLNAGTYLPMRPLFDYEGAAELYRHCRQAGTTPRSLTDCLIATVAIAADVALLHADVDFDRIAEVTPLRIAAVD